MLQLIQPAATLFVGFAMFTYGLIQAILHRPATATFIHFGQQHTSLLRYAPLPSPHQTRRR